MTVLTTEILEKEKGYKKVNDNPLEYVKEFNAKVNNMDYENDLLLTQNAEDGYLVNIKCDYDIVYPPPIKTVEQLEKIEDILSGNEK